MPDQYHPRWPATGNRGGVTQCGRAGAGWEPWAGRTISWDAGKRLGGDEQISWACHVGGIVAGALLVLVLRSRDVPLFDHEIVTPRAVVTKQPSAVRPVEAKPAPRWGRQ